MSLNKEFVITPKVRNSNLELYRIIVMLLIVMHHYVVNSGLMALMDEDPLNPKSLFLYIVGMWGKTGINCFVLITGYFMCKSHITLYKLLKLLLEIEFYNILIYLTFVIAGYIDYSFGDFLWQLLPIHSVSDGFVSCYLVFFLFIPFLNILVSNMNKKEHFLLIILCIGVYSIYNTLPGIEVVSNDSIWFCILYIISSYIRCYPLKNDMNTSFWAFSLVASVVMAIVSVFCLAYWRNSLGAYAFVGWPSAPLAVFISITAFMFFKSLKIRQSKFINIVGGCTFAVLLIHANSDTMRQWLWKDFCNNVGHYAYDSIYLHAILVPIAVFVICSIIEYFRMKVIERPLLDFTFNMVHKYFPNAK